MRRSGVRSPPAPPSPPCSFFAQFGNCTRKASCIRSAARDLRGNCPSRVGNRFLSMIVTFLPNNKLRDHAQSFVEAFHFETARHQLRYSTIGCHDERIIRFSPHPLRTEPL